MSDKDKKRLDKLEDVVAKLDGQINLIQQEMEWLRSEARSIKELLKKEEKGTIK